MGHRHALFAATAPFVLAAVAHAEYPRAGWTATLSTLSHNVSGTVTILDERTLQVDDFTYDGGGIDVFFYLGAENTNEAFKNGLPVGDNLLGMAYNGESFILELGEGETLDGWNAISVWCVTAAVNFGSGEFLPPEECYADFDGSGDLGLFDFLAFVNAFNADDLRADCDDNGDLTLFDFLCFVGAFNAGC